jgi:hypothetical protein
MRGMAVIETTTFRLTEGTEDDAFLAADEWARTSFLYQQPGLLRATTARNEDAAWIVVVLWATVEDAEAAAARADADPASAQVRGLVDAATLVRRRYTTFD